jgi:hypothetical protein
MHIKGNSKFKIFFYLVFAIVAIVLITEVSKFLTQGFSAINSKKKEINCANLDYDILQKNHGAKNLTIEFISNSPNFNITKLTIITDIESKEYINNFDQVIGSSQNSEVFFDNVFIDQSFQIYFNDCKDQKQIIIK